MADPKVGRVSFDTLTLNPTGTLSPRFVPEFEPDGAELIPELVFATRADFAAIVNLAIRVGRGTSPIKELSDRLAPYGVRRKP